MNMIPNSTTVSEPFDIPVGVKVEFTAEEHDMPSEVELLNEYADLLTCKISHPDFFDPFAEYKPIKALHGYFVRNFLFVFQHFIGKKVSKDGRFLVLHYDFFYNHFLALLANKSGKTMEGETGRVLQNLYRRMENKEEVEADCPYLTKEQINAYYIAFKTLYQGDPSSYLKLIATDL